MLCNRHTLVSKTDTALPSMASQHNETNRHYSKCHTNKFLEDRGKVLSLEERHIFLTGMEVKLAGAGLWGWELEWLDLAIRPSLLSSFLGWATAAALPISKPHRRNSSGHFFLSLALLQKAFVSGPVIQNWKGPKGLPHPTSSFHGRGNGGPERLSNLLKNL